MTRYFRWLMVVGSVLATGCEFKNTTELFTPTAPSASSASATGTGGASSSSSSASSASAASSSSPSASTSDFEGSWSSGTLTGLPQVGSCTDLEWSISSQSATSVSGIVSAVCGGVADITATLTGQMAAGDVINLSARGEAVGLGLTCGFDLTGVGHRESEDAWRLDYEGATCLGRVSGSELLRRASPAQPSAPSPTPSPGHSPQPSPSPSQGTGPVACAGNTGKQIVECVEKRYPSYLAAGVSLKTRTVNMQFLRDRIIETSKCKGMDVGLNLKRGGPSISTDFLVWRHGGLTEGVDIGAGYDNKSRPLDLIWHTYGPPNYGHPYYKDYGPVSCH